MIAIHYSLTTDYTQLVSLDLSCPSYNKVCINKPGLARHVKIHNIVYTLIINQSVGFCVNFTEKNCNSGPKIHCRLHSL